MGLLTDLYAHSKCVVNHIKASRSKVKLLSIILPAQSFWEMSSQSQF